MCMLCCRKILSADTVTASQDSTKDEAIKEKEIENSVTESCTGDSSSVNVASEKPDNGDNCAENSANGHLPNVESAISDSKDSIPDNMDTSTSVSKADDDTAGDDVQCSSVSAVSTSVTEADDNTADDARCSSVLAVQSDIEETVSDLVQSAPGEKCSETDTDTQSSAAGADCSEHQTAACSRTTLEQTHDDDITLSDKTVDHLQSKGQDSSLHGDSDVKICTESTNDLHPDLSRSLLNEVNGHLL